MDTYQSIAHSFRPIIDRRCKLLARCGDLVADEIEQEVALVLFVEYGNRPMIDYRRTALRTIATCIKREQRQQGKAAVANDATGYVALGSDDPAFDDIESKIVIEDMLEQMSPVIRQPMRMRYEYGLSVRNIAEILATPTTTIADRLRAGGKIVEDYMNGGAVLMPKYRYQ